MIITFILLTPLKLFTVKIEVEQQPTTGIAISKSIIIKNHRTVSDITVKEYCDENNYDPIRIDETGWDIGYDFAVKVWWLFLIIITVNITKKIKSKDFSYKLK